MTYTAIHALCDHINERPSNEPPLEWWLALYDHMEKAEAGAERLTALHEEQMAHLPGASP